VYSSECTSTEETDMTTKFNTTTGMERVRSFTNHLTGNTAKIFKSVNTGRFQVICSEACERRWYDTEEQAIKAALNY